MGPNPGVVFAGSVCDIRRRAIMRRLVRRLNERANHLDPETGFDDLYMVDARDSSSVNNRVCVKFEMYRTVNTPDEMQQLEDDIAAILRNGKFTR